MLERPTVLLIHPEGRLVDDVAAGGSRSGASPYGLRLSVAFIAIWHGLRRFAEQASARALTGQVHPQTAGGGGHRCSEQRGPTARGRCTRCALAYPLTAGGIATSVRAGPEFCPSETPCIGPAILGHMADVTQTLSRIEQGEPSAADQLLPLVYDKRRRLAAAKMANEKPGQTLQATALVHDAYLRLVDVKKTQLWDSRGHFLRRRPRPCGGF